MGFLAYLAPIALAALALPVAGVPSGPPLFCDAVGFQNATSVPDVKDWVKQGSDSQGHPFVKEFRDSVAPVHMPAQWVIESACTLLAYTFHCAKDPKSCTYEEVQFLESWQIDYDGAAPVYGFDSASGPFTMSSDNFVATYWSAT